MINTKFEAYKVQRELKRSGKLYEVLRDGVNRFGEPDPLAKESLGVIRGIYHEQSANVQYNMGDTTLTRTEKIPMILCMYESWESLGVRSGDYLFINGKRFNVVGCVNVQEWGIIGDVSLEVVDDGVRD